MAQQLALPLDFNPELGFDQFWPGPNTEVLSHLRRAALGQDESLLVIWGGCGKTHLLNACCATAARAGRSAAYLPLPLLRQYGPEALDGLDAYAMLCLDGLEAVAGDLALETALFTLFNRMRERGGQLLASAVLPPAQLLFALPDLASRLSWGLTLHLQPLADDDLLAALILKAQSLGLGLPPPVGRFLMLHARRDLPSLTRLLERLDRASLAAQRKLTLPFVKQHIGENS